MAVCIDLFGQFVHDNSRFDLDLDHIYDIAVLISLVARKPSILGSVTRPSLSQVESDINSGAAPFGTSV